MSNRAALSVVFLAGLVALASGGCGGPAGCPAGTPAAGTSCANRGLVCESAGGAHERCSTVSTCQDSLDPKHPNTFKWTVTAAMSCNATNDAACPTDFMTAPVAMVCPMEGLTCDYAEGRCDCVPCNPTGVNWRCRSWSDGLDPACPSDRPALGSKCDIDGNIICRYDNACTVSFGTDQICTGGIWIPRQGLATPCAAPVCLVSG